MYDGKSYDTYSFEGSGTVRVDTMERDAFDPEFTECVASKTIPLDEAIMLWAEDRDDGLNLYMHYFMYAAEFGSEAAAEFRSLAARAGVAIDASVPDLNTFLLRRMEANER